MKTVEQFMAYCDENKTGHGMTRGWMEKHFTVAQNQLSGDEYAKMAFIGLRNYKSPTKHDNYYAYLITNKRIMMAQKKVIGENFQSVSLSNINDITLKIGMAFGVITFDTIRETFNVAIAKAYAHPIHDRIREILYESKEDPQAPPQSYAKSPIDQIKDLKELLDIGAISQEEFESKKTDLLSKI